MISYDEALQRVVGSISPIHSIERPLQDAAGLVLAAPATARWGMPLCNNSAMDGYAICTPLADDKSGHLLIGASYAGHPFPGKVTPGEAVRITTGAALPAGATTVVPIEDADEKGDQVIFKVRPEAGQNVRRAGEEYQPGEVLVAKGTRLRAGDIALLASAGVENVRIYPPLRVAVISTGDELVELGQKPGPGQVINSNVHFLRTRLCECGCLPICLGIGGDEQKKLDQLIDQALDTDVIITTGGVSVGEKDHVQETLENRNFEKIFWKVAIKPGKPVLFGKVADTPFFGLPGNPAATAATFELFVKPALKRLAGHDVVHPAKRIATLTHEVKGGGKRQVFLWCQLNWQKDRYTVSVGPRQGSGQNRCLTQVNAMLPVPIGVDRIEKGKTVEVLLLDDTASWQ